jgi:hypothetical protein
MTELNSIEKNEIQIKIGNIIGKSKKNGKLSKVDENEIIELFKALFEDKRNWNEGIENILNLPAEAGASALINIWELQNDEEQLFLINEFLKKDKSLNSIIKQLYFINELFKKSPDAAMETLHSVSITVTDFGKKIPNKKILTTCARTILVNECLYTISPEEHPIKKVDFPSTGLLLVSTLLHYWENSPRTGNELDIVHKLISWISLNGFRVEFERSLINEIQEKACSIDVDSQRILLNLGFINNIFESNTDFPLFVEQISETPSVLKKEPEKKTLLDVKEVQVTETLSVVNEEKIFINPLGDTEKQVSKRTKGEHLLKQLRNYLGGLETANNDLQEAINIAANEVKIEKYKRHQLEVTNDVLRKGLSEKITENKILNSQIDELNAEIKRLRQDMIEKEREHQEKLQSMIDMIEKESVFVKDEFKNKLTSKLRLEYLDFKDILSEEMTVELGENLRAQLENIFRLLKQEGMNF